MGQSIKQGLVYFMLCKRKDRIKGCPDPTRKESKDAIPSQNICQQNGVENFKGVEG